VTHLNCRVMFEYLTQEKICAVVEWNVNWL